LQNEAADVAAFFITVIVICESQLKSFSFALVHAMALGVP